MPIDKTKLQSVLADMKKTLLNQDGFKTDPIKSQRFIKKLHSYCKYELERLGFPPDSIIPEFEIHGFKKTKDMDIAVVPKNIGAVLGISVKSQMKSIAKNTHNELEVLSGDVTNIHQKHNFLTIGNLYLLPTKTIIGNEENPKIEKYIDNFKKMSFRKNTSGDFDKFEETALLVVDFTTNPPEIRTDIPTEESSLRIEDFFDKLFETFKERNSTLKLKKF